jgi:glucosamine-6-phosphate deaminase
MVGISCRQAKGRSNYVFVKIERDYETMSERGARIVADLVLRKPTAVLGLATGSTPVGLYSSLVRIAREEQIDFSQVTTFNLDEYEGLPPGHPESYHTFMQRNLFDGLGLSESQTNLLDGLASDPAAECADFEDKIRKAGGIDLQVLGIGGDGHIAFCEPGSSLAGRTSLVALHPKTIADNARFFASEEEVPRRALTMGVGTILEARSCLILAKGRAKAEVWAKMIEGPVTSQLTASAMQLHPWVIAISDRDAAYELQHADYYRHIDRETADQPVLPRWVFEPELDPRRLASAPAR